MTDVISKVYRSNNLDFTFQESCSRIFAQVASIKLKVDIYNFFKGVLRHFSPIDCVLFHMYGPIRFLI